MFGFIVTLVIVGLVAGALARLIVPGKDHLGFGGTVLLGIVGSFIGGFLGYVIFGKDHAEGYFQPSGLVGSIIGGVIALLIYRQVTHRRSVRA